MKLVIVESPTKAKTIQKFLSKGYTVKSSFGHVRDLPQKVLGVDIEKNFQPKYVVPPKAKKVVAQLKKEAKKKEVILATDEDREGEAIAWHLAEALKLDSAKTQRIVFHEITKSAIENALLNPRFIDFNLVDAQQARRVLDRLVGYKLSPLLWKKIKRGLSAGRVQSVALRLIVEREREIEKFKPEEYWTIEAELKKEQAEQTFLAKLVAKNGKKIPKLGLKQEKEAKNILRELKEQQYQVKNIETKKVFSQPPAPLATSSLQQEAARRFGFSAKQTMMLAQQLYEGVEAGRDSSGLITYMRTDSLNLAPQFLDQTQHYLKEKFGPRYSLPKPRFFKTKSKGAQEAHEAIRPTDISRDPESLKSYLDPRQLKLYRLIWQRTLACQMPPAEFESQNIAIEAGPYGFQASGSRLTFDGFLKVYAQKLEDKILPPLTVKEILQLVELLPKQHFTKPPARYSEAMLIKTLEENGIGRPSTYAPTISVIQERDYVVKNEDKRFQPTEIGLLVNDLLVEHFPNIVDIKFTAQMEEKLDEVAEGKKKWAPLIKEFYGPFEINLKLKDKEIKKHQELTGRFCPECGKELVIKFGRFGKFYACSGFPECKYTEQNDAEKKLQQEFSHETCEVCGAPMTVKTSRFGSFLGCSKYPECKNIKKIEKTIGVACPQCDQGQLVQKTTKRRRTFYGCSQYPKCDFALWDKPLNEKCPHCGSLMVEKNGQKICSKSCQ